MSKITCLTGKLLIADSATSWKDPLAFARVLIEMTIIQAYPYRIMFEHEIREVI